MEEEGLQADQKAKFVMLMCKNYCFTGSLTPTVNMSDLTIRSAMIEQKKVNCHFWYLISSVSIVYVAGNSATGGLWGGLETSSLPMPEKYFPWWSPIQVLA